MRNRRSFITLGVATLALGGCATLGPVAETGLTSDGALPPEVLALAAPYQDLRAIEYRPDDGCYWYWHDGPVERTMLPLRSAAGGHICRGQA